MDIRQASAALDRMAQFASACSGAREVIDVLINLQQVKGELEAAIAGLRARMEITRAKLIELETQADTKLIDAGQRAAAIIAAAEQRAAQILKDAERG